MEQKKLIPAGDEWNDRSIREIVFPPSEKFGDELALVTAGDGTVGSGSWGTLTAGFGLLGRLWDKDVATIYVGSARHTYSFLEKNEIFTLSFFPKQYRKALMICGTTSGRDTDKADKAGITPIAFPGGAIGFQEASEVFICRKLYAQDIDPRLFVRPEYEPEFYPAARYPHKDYHRMYIGEIVSIKCKRTE